MALSMDEQRMLAEIERRLSAEDPGLAARLSSFKRPGPAATFRTPRGRVIGSLFTVVLVAVISMMVYAMVPFRAHGPKTTSSPQASSNSAPAQVRPAGSAPARNGSGAKSAPARTSATTSNSAAAHHTVTRTVGHASTVAG